MIYKIYELTEAYATDSESGQKLYDLIHPELRSGQKGELDFSGVEVFASAFFNFAIGQLLSDLDPETLNQHLKFVALTADGQYVLNRVIENAKRYYADAQYRKAVNDVIESYAASF